MILPTKYLKLKNSLIGLGAVLLQNINGKQTVSLLWDKTKDLEDVRTFERFTLALDLLFALGLIKFEDGVLIRCKK